MFPADATAENKSVPEQPDIDGVVPEVDNKTKSVVFATKLVGKVKVSAFETELKFIKILINLKYKLRPNTKKILEMI